MPVRGCTTWGTKPSPMYVALLMPGHIFLSFELHNAQVRIEVRYHVRYDKGGEFLSV